MYDAETVSTFLKLPVIQILPCKLKPSFDNYLLCFFSGKGTILGAEDTAIRKLGTC